MKLYNELFNFDPAADELLAMLGIQRDFPPRFRDCFLSEKGDRIIVLTRTGGSYKTKWQEQNAAMRGLPGFVLDAEEPFDVSYVRFIYLVPMASKERAKQLRTMYPVRVPSKLWKDWTARMNAPGAANDPEVIAAMQKMAPLVDHATRSAQRFGVGAVFDDDI